MWVLSPLGMSEWHNDDLLVSSLILVHRIDLNFLFPARLQRLHESCQKFTLQTIGCYYANARGTATTLQRQQIQILKFALKKLSRAVGSNPHPFYFTPTLFIKTLFNENSEPPHFLQFISHLSFHCWYIIQSCLFDMDFVHHPLTTSGWDHVLHQNSQLLPV